VRSELADGAATAWPTPTHVRPLESGWRGMARRGCQMRLGVGAGTGASGPIDDGSGGGGTHQWCLTDSARLPVGAVARAALCYHTNCPGSVPLQRNERPVPRQVLLASLLSALLPLPPPRPHRPPRQGFTVGPRAGAAGQSRKKLCAPPPCHQQATQCRTGCWLLRGGSARSWTAPASDC